MFTTAGEVLALVAAVAGAPDLATAVEVFYAMKVDSPKASVKSRGFATVNPRLPNGGTDNPTGGSNNKRTPPVNDNPFPDDDDDDDDDDDEDEGDGDGDEDEDEEESLGDGKLAAIGDTVWFDADKDGHHDDGELPVPLAEVSLFSAGLDEQIGGGDDVLIGRQRTGLAGEYLFALLQPGTYYVALDLSTIPVGFRPTRRDASDDAYDSDADEFGFTHTTRLDPGEVDLTVDIGLID